MNIMVSENDLGTLTSFTKIYENLHTAKKTHFDKFPWHNFIYD